ncbi:MAG: hypothetical protein SFZ02_15885 [bacterium]|nr:hypothetical protein [bacterium]
MTRKTIFIIGIITVIIAGGIIALTAALPPQNQPAFDVAVRFMNLAGTGQDEGAMALLSDELQAYVTQNCPDSSVSACIDAYTPSEWGNLLRDGAAVYRRSIRDGDAWDIQLIATYEKDKGFAGVCIYHRVEEIAPDDWRVTAWSGFIACDDPNSGLPNLRASDAVNRVP